MNESLLLIAAGLLRICVVALRRRAAERLAAEEAARREAERLAAEEAAHREAERLAAEEAAHRGTPGRRGSRIREAERLAAEEAARREAERLAAEVAARLEAERLAAEEAAHREAELPLPRKPHTPRSRTPGCRGGRAPRSRTPGCRGSAARRETARFAAEEAARREAERLAALEVLRQEEAKAQVLSVPPQAVVLKAKAAEQTVVMVADDSKLVRIKTGRLLTVHKYQVVMAEDGLDAAKQIENSVPDLLITDWRDMPGMGGLQLVRHLRANPRTLGLPIIMVTSDSEVLRTEAMESGVNVVLGKPYPEEQLIAHIQRLVMTRTDALS